MTPTEALAATPPTQSAIESQLQSLQETLARHHAPLAALQLAAYAIDAMRVLQRLDRHADAYPAFHQAIRQACADWRNPGAFHDPADLVTDVQAYALDALQQVFQASADQLAHVAKMACVHQPGLSAPLTSTGP